VTIQVHNSRAVGLTALAIGGFGLVLAGVWEPIRSPYPLFAFTVVFFVGVWRILDRKVRLAISDEGIRYADWGPALVPWRELSGYPWKTWRRNPYLQLVPRRPSDLVARFSPVGRLNHWSARLIRMPCFAIAVTPLHVSEGDLEGAVARHLPPAGPTSRTACERAG